MEARSVQSFRLNFGLKIFLAICIAIGVVAFRLTYLQNSQRAWMNVAIGCIFFMSLGLAGLFFTAMQHLTSARWSVALRRVLEAMTLSLPIAALLSVLIYIGKSQIYVWTNAAVVRADPMLQWKSPLLNPHHYGLHLVIYFLIWFACGFFMLRNSFKQDKTGDAELTNWNKKISAPITVLFALSCSMAGFEILMSMEPHFYSTIFGVYFFAGLFQAGLAMFFILSYLLYRAGVLRGFADVDHFHDISRFIFGFSIFWAYIGFSQFLLIWYADLPEETFFLKIRMENGWEWISLALLCIRFIAPFIILMPWAIKRSFKIMIAMSLLILAGEWLDLFWVAMPTMRLSLQVENVRPVIGWQEVTIGLAFLSLFVLVVGLIMERIRMIPIRDPRLETSIHYYHH